ncbi:hypothetical protein ACODM8_04890 [Vibrio ostreicida]|uniref:DUF2384 domain-containing protein n=1 Tax=Vibrio ostreicida TaxID=526588 RepID=A0ABT8BX16_9VIBR|nr:hypothetical protein [Vibrio ostreicida]MDN3611538.1 hypothetical protein [Vibrio ostreicida]NPD09032.1 XRE family transcriptional regulator [Vibrio ostreicida]
MRTSILDNVINAQGIVEPGKMASFFHTNIKEIASVSGVPFSTLSRSDRYTSMKTQQVLRNCTEVINRILPWTGDPIYAYAWYRSESLPEFGGLTAEQLVKQDRMDAVRLYLNHVSEGGYA